MKNKKLLSLVLAIAMLVSMFSVGLGSISVSAAAGEKAYISAKSGEDLNNETIITKMQTTPYLNNCLYLSISESDDIPNLTNYSSAVKRVKNIRELYISSPRLAGDVNFSGIEDCKYLKTITLKGSLDNERTRGVLELLKNTTVETVNLDYNKITDFSCLEPLLEFKNLKNLNISNNPGVSDLSSLLFLNGKIKSLTVGDYYTSVDYDSLAKMTELTSLTIDFDKNLTDLSALSSLTNLENLSCQYANITDISAISNFTKLKSINFTRNKITDISPISNLTDLTSINFRENSITDISALKNLTKLNDINFRYNQIRDISVVLNDLSVYNADFGHNIISDVTGLQECFDRLHESYVSGAQAYYDLGGNPLKESGEYLAQVNAGLGTVGLSGIYSFAYYYLSVEDFRPLIYDNLTVDNETKTITVNSKVDASYVSICNQSPINKTIKYKVTLDGETYDYLGEATTRFKFVKPEESNVIKATLSTKHGTLSAVDYDLIINFVETPKPTFEAKNLTLKNAANKVFDAENSALTIDTEANYVRVYKALTNGSTISVDAEKYGFVIEYDKFYQINKAALALSDLNIATFEMITDSGDTVTTTVNFPGAGELPFTKLFKITNYDSLTQEENVINLDIVDTKTFSIIYKDVADGTTLTIESDSAFVEERDNCYVLRQRAAGETITMTYGETTYTINLTK